MSMPPFSTVAADHKDRRAACIAFGVAELLMGALCALMVPLMLLATRVAAPRTDTKALLMGLSLYVLLATALVWLGIGSILCRRWARTLLLILAWSWIVAGLTGVAVLAILMPQMRGRLAPGAAVLVVTLVVSLIFGVFFVVIPGAMVLFYRSKNVRATFEARDPLQRWTDTCPLPVLTTSLWFAFGALWLALMPMTYGSVLPFFGRFISGPPATAVQLLLAAVWLWLARAFYRRDLNALWASIALLMAGFASTVVTYARADILEMYRLLGYPPEQIEAMRQLGVFGGQTMAWLVALLGVATVAFLIWLKKYFPSAGSSVTNRPQGTLTRT